MSLLNLSVSVVLLCALGACAGTGQTTGGQKELATLSDQTSLQKRANIRLQLAVGYLEQRQMQVALDEIKQALAADPDYADAYGVRALIYMEMNEIDLADENFKRAMRLAPNNPDLANNYGWFLCQNKREAEGLRHFEQALKNRNYASPEKALNNAGLCSLRLKQDDAAEDYFRQAFKLDPASQMTNVNLAKMYFGQREFQRAHFYISRVTRANKSDVLPANVLWLAIRIERKLGDSAAESVLVTQLRRHHSSSAEFAAWQRGAFDE